jgi:transcription antitermination factor NusG
MTDTAQMQDEVGTSVSPPEPEDVLAFPVRLATVGYRWSCLYTRPRHEKAVAAVCVRADVPHYLPLKRVLRRYASGNKERWLPLFPGYVFCCADDEHCHILRREENILSVMGVFDQETLLRELREVRKALSVCAELETLPCLAKGRSVQIRRGAFAGINGIITEVRKRLRVALNVTLAGHSVLIEVNADDVDLAL